MNQAHYHLLLNHAPIIGPAFGIAVLVAGFVFKSAHVKRVALGIFVLSALLAIPAYLTGEGAEEVTEKIPGMDETLIETHEELGETFLWLVSALGIIAALVFIAEVTMPKISRWLYLLTLAVAIAGMFVAKSVGTSGGEIRHTEIRSGNISAAPQGSDDQQSQAPGSEEDD